VTMSRTLELLSRSAWAAAFRPISSTHLVWTSRADAFWAQRCRGHHASERRDRGCSTSVPAAPMNAMPERQSDPAGGGPLLPSATSMMMTDLGLGSEVSASWAASTASWSAQEISVKTKRPCAVVRCVRSWNAVELDRTGWVCRRRGQGQWRVRGVYQAEHRRCCPGLRPDRPLGKRPRT